jgi:YHS domain-containing protein
MQVEVANAPARSQRDGETFYFCSDHCRQRFETAEQPAEARV